MSNKTSTTKTELSLNALFVGRLRISIF